MWNLVETFESRVVNLERELLNCHTDVNELTAGKSNLSDKNIAAETTLKDVNDARTMQGARLGALETEPT